MFVTAQGVDVVKVYEEAPSGGHIPRPAVPPMICQCQDNEYSTECRQRVEFFNKMMSLLHKKLAEPDLAPEHVWEIKQQIEELMQQYRQIINRHVNM